MNTVPFQEQHSAPDDHYHICEHCSLSFFHTKSRIPPGGSHLAHVCPNPKCGKPVNSPPREIPKMLSVDFSHWYGRDLSGNEISGLRPKKKKGR